MKKSSLIAAFILVCFTASAGTQQDNQMQAKKVDKSALKTVGGVRPGGGQGGSQQDTTVAPIPPSGPRHKIDSIRPLHMKKMTKKA